MIVNIEIALKSLSIVHRSQFTFLLEKSQMQYKKRKLLLGMGAAITGTLLPAAKLFALPILTATDVDPALIAEPDPVNFTGALVSVSQFGIYAQAADDASVTNDYYSKMLDAIAYAKANNVSLQFDAGRYNFAGPASATDTGGMFGGLTFSIIGVPAQTQIYLMNSGGANVRWDWQANSKNIVVSGLTFNVLGTPTSATNDAKENSTVLRFTNADNVRLDQLTFNDPYGGAVLFRNVTNSAITNCSAIGCYKDSFHCTGTSQNIIYYKCTVKDGGDDGFAVVGYATGTGGLGQPTNIRHVFCEVYGVKFARCVSYVGSLNCINVGAIIDGQIPTDRASSALYPFGSGGNQHNQAGIYIAAESVVNSAVPASSYTCYGNQNLIIRDFQMKNCGNGGLFAIQIYNKSPMTSDNIQLVNGAISKSGKTAITCGGGNAYCTNVLFENLEINDTTSPNGASIPYTDSNGNIAFTQVAPGEGANGAFDLGYLRDFVIRNCTAINTGNNHVINIKYTCQGAADIDLITSDINKKGYNGPCILNYDSAATTQMSEVNFKLFIKSQGGGSVPNSVGSPYFFARVINTNGKSANTLSVDVTHYMSMSRNPIFNVAGQAPEQADTGSPRIITNTSNVRRLYNVYGNGVSAGANAPQHIKTDANGNTVVTVESANKGPGMYFLDPGESLKVYYTAAISILWWPVTGL
ncbi:hypothetical protein GJ699_02720 [Duganella sp. FT80W]|uniref:Right handed beta helix domain-containing protein n=1 Tax=Duganella guangzhouensis TaxID=2666084 RepID=A0A6I2KTF3_9BURK|nr:hypothetical protein [Duganella guangzhouensis]MRW88891.1 hypothetical protein [Duganella guangzhouensis]